jgi:hypothetical protein
VDDVRDVLAVIDDRDHAPLVEGGTRVGDAKAHEVTGT